MKPPPVRAMTIVTNVVNNRARWTNADHAENSESYLTRTSYVYPNDSSCFSRSRLRCQVDDGIKRKKVQASAGFPCVHTRHVYTRNAEDTAIHPSINFAYVTSRVRREIQARLNASLIEYGG